MANEIHEKAMATLNMSDEAYANIRDIRDKIGDQGAAIIGLQQDVHHLVERQREDRDLLRKMAESVTKQELILQRLARVDKDAEELTTRVSRVEGSTIQETRRIDKLEGFMRRATWGLRVLFGALASGIAGFLVRYFSGN